MNKKQREAKRKNAQAHQKKVKDLGVERTQKRVDRKQLITRELFKADRVITEIPKAPVSDVFEEFFAKHLEQGSGIPMTPELDRLIRSTNPFPIIGRKLHKPFPLGDKGLIVSVRDPVHKPLIVECSIQSI